MNLILSMFWFGLKCMKNFISSYSLPFGLSHGTRRTNLSPQDQAKYKLSSDQAHVHVSSPGLCALVSPFTGFSSSTTPTSSTNKIKLTSAWKKIYLVQHVSWKNQYKIKLFLPSTQEFILFGNWSHMYHQFKIFIHETLISIRNDSLWYYDTSLSIHMQFIQIVYLLMATIEIMTNK